MTTLGNIELDIVTLHMDHIYSTHLMLMTLNLNSEIQAY